MLEPGDQMPHFEVQTIDGEAAGYAAIWQRRHLVLVVLPPDDHRTPHEYPPDVAAIRSATAGEDTACIVTRDPVAGLPPPGVLIADRWGEIVFARAVHAPGELPSASDLREWIDFVRRRCPECEGETR